MFQREFKTTPAVVLLGADQIRIGILIKDSESMLAAR
jgi:hypothetical protein